VGGQRARAPKSVEASHSCRKSAIIDVRSSKKLVASIVGRWRSRIEDREEALALQHLGSKIEVVEAVELQHAMRCRGKNKSAAARIIGPPIAKRSSAGGNGSQEGVAANEPPTSNNARPCTCWFGLKDDQRRDLPNRSFDENRRRSEGDEQGGFCAKARVA